MPKGMLERYVVELAGREHELSVERLADGSFCVQRDGRSVTWDARRVGGSWSLTPVGGGAVHEIDVDRAGPTGERTVGDGRHVGVAARILDPLLRAAEQAARARPAGPAEVKSPMPGKIVRALVKLGEHVTAGQPVVVVEAMKMENELKAPREGTVRELRGTEGQAIEAGQVLLVLE